MLYVISPPDRQGRGFKFLSAATRLGLRTLKITEGAERVRTTDKWHCRARLRGTSTAEARYEGGLLTPGEPSRQLALAFVVQPASSPLANVPNEVPRAASRSPGGGDLASVHQSVSPSREAISVIPPEGRPRMTNELLEKTVPPRPVRNRKGQRCEAVREARVDLAVLSLAINTGGSMD